MALVGFKLSHACMLQGRRIECIPRRVYSLAKDYTFILMLGVSVNALLHAGFPDKICVSFCFISARIELIRPG